MHKLIVAVILISVCGSMLAAYSIDRDMADHMKADSMVVVEDIESNLKYAEIATMAIHAFSASSTEVTQQDMKDFISNFKLKEVVGAGDKNIVAYGHYDFKDGLGVLSLPSGIYQDRIKFSGSHKPITRVGNDYVSVAELSSVSFLNIRDLVAHGKLLVFYSRSTDMHEDTSFVVIDAQKIIQEHQEGLSASGLSLSILVQPKGTVDKTAHFYQQIFEKDSGDIIVSFDRMKGAGEAALLSGKGFAVLLSGFLLTGLIAGLIYGLQKKRQIMSDEKKLIEEELDIQKRFLESVVENIPGAIFVKEVKKDYRFYMLNREAEKIFCLSREEMIGKTDFDVFNKEQAASFREADQMTVKAGEVVDVPEEVVSTAQGDMILHTRKVPVYDTRGDVKYILGFSEDITVKKQNETELVSYRENLEQMVVERTLKLEHAMQKAEEANKIKSEFIATMSHEIRSPMSGVLGMAELLLDSPLNSEQKGLAKTIINSGEVLMNIIEDILDFSKIEANKLEIDPVAIDLLELVDDICLLYSSRAREKAIEIAVRYMPGSEQYVYADPVRIRQILGNLINNAIKFTQQGHILITVGQDKSAQLDDGMVQMIFSVADTGIGIASQDQEKIFDKFSQANSSTTREYGGTGLGLSICRKLLAIMGGNISVRSDIGHGSVFSFSLPLKRNRDEKMNQAVPGALRGLRVLIVDDLPIVLTIVAEQLTAAGMQCVTAPNGQKAIDVLMETKARGESFDIAVIDYLMPGMNGEMLARAINDEPAFRDICLIMLTAAGYSPNRNESERQSFSSCITKPVSARTLIDKISAIWTRYSHGEKEKWIPSEVQLSDREREDIAATLLQGRRVLLVDDSRLNQAFGEEVLKQAGCGVTIAANGEEAIAFLRKQSFDLVLMDCQMPIMDGFAAAIEIGKLKQAQLVRKNMPIIALTANAMKGDRERCLDAGMDDYITKPIRKQELVEKVSFWIQGSGSVDQDVIIDDRAFAEARALFRDKFDFILQCYIEDMTAYLREMNHAAAARAAEEMILPAHTIKSSSRRLGAMAISYIAENIEKSIRMAPPEALGALLDDPLFQKDITDLIRAFDRTHAEITHRMHAREGLAVAD